MNSENMEWLLELKEALSSNGYYEVHFPNGETKEFSWKDFHKNFKRKYPLLFKQVVFRWVSY